MSLQHHRSIILSLLVTFIPAVAAAQEAEPRTSVLAPGTWSIQLPFPTDNPVSLGIWNMRSSRTALGLIGNVHLQRDDDDELTHTVTNVDIGPALKRYHQLHPTVAAFGIIGVTGIFQRVSYGVIDVTETVWGGAANIGVGAEWFPFDRVSLGGTTGLRGGITTADRSDTETDQTTLFLHTYTTAVQVQIYF